MACPFQDVRDQNKSSGADEATSIDVCDPSFLLGENTTVHSFEALGALDGTHNMAILMISRVAEVDLQSCVCPSMRSCKNRQTTGITRKLHLNFPNQIYYIDVLCFYHQHSTSSFNNKAQLNSETLTHSCFFGLSISLNCASSPTWAKVLLVWVPA